jgi:DNA-binding MarR family transcriptional regulator
MGDLQSATMLDDKSVLSPKAELKRTVGSSAEQKLDFHRVLQRVAKSMAFAAAREMYARHRLTLPQFEVLSEVMQRPDGVRLGELAHLIMMTNGNITRLVCRLEEERYVVRKGTTDKRVSMICITPKGAELALAATETHRGLILALINSDDLEDVLAAASKAR